MGPETSWRPADGATEEGEMVELAHSGRHGTRRTGRLIMKHKNHEAQGKCAREDPFTSGNHALCSSIFRICSRW